MALAVVDIKPDRVQVGSIFDTNKKYVFLAPGMSGPGYIKFLSGKTINSAYSRARYQYDGLYVDLTSGTNYAELAWPTGEYQVLGTF